MVLNGYPPSKFLLNHNVLAKKRLLVIIIKRTTVSHIASVFDSKKCWCKTLISCRKSALSNPDNKTNGRNGLSLSIIINNSGPISSGTLTDIRRCNRNQSFNVFVTFIPPTGYCFIKEAPAYYTGNRRYCADLIMVHLEALR